MFAAALLVAACNTPAGVKITDTSAYGYSVSVVRDAMPGCAADARKRGLNEARKYCDAKGRELRVQATQADGTDAAGCRFEAAFACALPR